MTSTRDPEAARRYHRARYILVFAGAFEFLLVLAVLQATGFAASIASRAAARFPDAFWLEVAAVVLCVHGVLYLAGFPLQFIGGWRLEKKYELSNENFGRWLVDGIKSFVLSTALLLVLAEAFYAAVLRWPDHWWIAFSAVWAGAAVVLAAVFPTLIVPLFYPMKPLPEGPVRDRILALAARLRVRVKGVYEIALSRKTRKANAAVLGIGRLRRIVMGDTLLAHFSPEEVDVVLSHELGHYVRGHNRLGLAVHLVGGIAGIFVFFLVSREAMARLGASGLADPGIYPAILFAVASFQAASLPFLNAFSRRMEREADAFALESMRSKAAFVSAMRKLGEQNLADVDPNPWIERLLFSHPSILRRIRYAEEMKLI